MISIDTYQALEERIKRGKKEEFWDYVVFDEAHYFLCDSVFNTNTMLSYNYVKNKKILM